MAKMTKTALQKKMGAHTKKKKRAAEQRNEKTALQKKRALKIKQNEGHSPSKTDEQKGALHSNKPTVPTSSKLNLYWFYFPPYLTWFCHTLANCWLFSILVFSVI